MKGVFIKDKKTRPQEWAKDDHELNPNREIRFLRCFSFDDARRNTDPKLLACMFLNAYLDDVQKCRKDSVAEWLFHRSWRKWSGLQAETSTTLNTGSSIHSYLWSKWLKYSFLHGSDIHWHLHFGTFFSFFFAIFYVCFYSFSMVFSAPYGIRTFRAWQNYAYFPISWNYSDLFLKKTGDTRHFYIS